MTLKTVWLYNAKTGEGKIVQQDIPDVVFVDKKAEDKILYSKTTTSAEKLDLIAKVIGLVD